ncbi:protein FAM83A [Poecilia reticulata]|uniref:Family with sequence similarity 83 member A n=1 Tax=Poecilia reticulata TaxID=8081 RepID=A0A3P9PGF6_POERE|nr:PREDICTED: protein FAM83A [Poecilia reticulata]
MNGCNNISVLSYRRFQPVGKVRRRVQDLRIPSSSNYCAHTASGTKPDLSHNESARLAADCLLSRGLDGYRQVLQAEGEVDFLSELEKLYILQNGRDANTEYADDIDNMDKEFVNLFAHCESQTSSDSAVECLDQKIDKALDPSPEVFLQSDRTAAAMKDLVRQFLRKAKLVLAVVMDAFSDPELLCDLLEASRKRNVSVHLLLDHVNMEGFVSMWQELKLISRNFPKVSVRSVTGQTYSAKTGRKLTGQIAESFIIADWDEVLTGTYSFTWLSSMVHQSLLVLIKGASVSHFHQEFLRLHSSSKPVPGFVTFISLPQCLCLYSLSHEHPNGCNWKSHNTVTAACSRGEISLHPPQGDKQLREKIPPHLPLWPSVQTAAESGTGAKTELQNQNQIHGHPHLPDQTFSDVQLLNTTVKKNAEVQEPRNLNDLSLTHGRQNVHRQSGLKKQNSLALLDGSSKGVFTLQRNRNTSAGFTPDIQAQRDQLDSSRIAHAKVEPQLLSPPLSQKTRPNLSRQVSFRSSREYMPNLQPNAFRGTSKQEGFMEWHQGRLNSSSHTVTSCFKPSPTGAGTALGPQQQAESNRFLSGVWAMMQPHPVRLHWSPQKAARPGAMARYNSFSGAHETGQVGWRTLQSSSSMLLRRSLSLTDRSPAGYRGAGLHPV